MAYNTTTRTITSPVSIKDIQDALGKSDADIGTLCKANTVNKWARFKPLNVQGLFSIPYINTNVYGVQFGLALIHSLDTTKAAFANILMEYVRTRFKGAQAGTYLGYEHGVKYNQPQGGINSPYRMTDFVCSENPTVFGYKGNAELQMLYPESGTSAIGSCWPSGDGSTIDLASKSGDESLPNDYSILTSTDLNVNFANKSNQIWNNLSLPEIIKANGGDMSVLARGVIVTDGYVYFLAINAIPWDTWKGSQEAPLYGTWNYVEFYTTLPDNSYSGNGDFFIMPTFEGEVSFYTGDYDIQFALGAGTGNVIYADSMYKAYVLFRWLDGDQPSQWTLTVSVWKIDKTTHADIGQYFSADITTLNTFVSGATWYDFYFGVSLSESQNNAMFQLRIDGTRNGTSMSSRRVFTGTFVLESYQ